MVNLLTFKAEGGRESYLRYAQGTAPHLERVGGTVRFAGQLPTTVIGEGERPGWDAILVVEYPTPRAFLDMIGDPGYLEVHGDRAAALEHGDLIATSNWTMVD